MDPRLAALRRVYPTQEDPNLLPGKHLECRFTILRSPAEPEREMRTYEIDSLFPQVLAGKGDTAGIDEGSADLLYGFVRGLQPQVVLETGTHKGRSTKAIAEALRANAEIVIRQEMYTLTLHKGHIYTIDAEDHKILTSGAIQSGVSEYVTPIVGWTPDVYSLEPLKSLKGIEFAFLDGDHSDEGLQQDLDYVEAHRASECWVAVDNSRDDGWPNLRAFLSHYTKYPRISLGTCTGLDLIWMR